MGADTPPHIIVIASHIFWDFYVLKLLFLLKKIGRFCYFISFLIHFWTNYIFSFFRTEERDVTFRDSLPPHVT